LKGVQGSSRVDRLKGSTRTAEGASAGLNKGVKGVKELTELEGEQLKGVRGS
jgi:hypothetical protein